MNSKPNGGSSRERDRPESLGDRLGREGAVALGLRRLQRQVAHDMRGSLNAISLNTALLGRAARGDLAGMADARERQEGWVQAIEEALARLTGSLDRWATLAAGDDGTPERLDLCGVLAELDASLGPLARRRALELEIPLPEAAIYVRAPKRDLIRSLASLAGASIESLGKSARLRLELTADAARATIAASAEEGPGEESPEPATGALLPAVLGVLAHPFETMGGRLEPAGRAGWMASWPLSEPDREREANR